MKCSEQSRLKSMAAAIARAASIAVGAVALIGMVYGEASAQNTISQIPGGTATAASFTLDNVQVAGILDTYSPTSGTVNTLVLQDSTGSVLAYQVPASVYPSPQPGDIIDLTITNTPYQDGPELKGSTITGFSLVSTGNPAPTYPVITLPQFLAASTTSGSGSIYGEGIVTIDNVQFVSGTAATLSTNTTYMLTDGTNTGVLYGYKSDAYVGGTDPTPPNGLMQINNLGGGNAPPLDITGYISNYYGESEFYPLAAVLAPEPSSFVMSVAGLLGLAAVAARRLRRKV